MGFPFKLLVLLSLIIVQTGMCKHDSSSSPSTREVAPRVVVLSVEEELIQEFNKKCQPTAAKSHEGEEPEFITLLKKYKEFLQGKATCTQESLNKNRVVLLAEFKHALEQTKLTEKAKKKIEEINNDLKQEVFYADNTQKCLEIKFPDSEGQLGNRYITDPCAKALFADEEPKKEDDKKPDASSPPANTTEQLAENAAKIAAAEPKPEPSEASDDAPPPARKPSQKPVRQDRDESDYEDSSYDSRESSARKKKDDRYFQDALKKMQEDFRDQVRAIQEANSNPINTGTGGNGRAPQDEQKQGLNDILPLLAAQQAQQQQAQQAAAQQQAQQAAQQQEFQQQLAAQRAQQQQQPQQPFVPPFVQSPPQAGGLSADQVASTVDRAVSGKLRDLYSSIEKRFDAIKPTANSNNNAAMMAGLFGGAGIPGLLGNINPYLPPGYLGAVPPVPGFASNGLLTSQPRTLGDAVKLLGRSGARSRIKKSSSARFTERKTNSIRRFRVRN